jgi:6-phosphogluconolactonase
MEARGTATLAVSGGSTPRLLFDALAGLSVQWNRVHLFFVDERSVPPDDAESNYRLAREYLIRPAGLDDHHVHRILGEADAVEAARAYSEEIARFLGLRPGVLPELDVLQAGVGDDGHTASLFPGDELVLDRRGIAAGLWAASRKQWRVTLLPGVLLAARKRCVLAAGAGKRAAIGRALHGPEDLLGTPAQLLRGAEWFLDEAAAPA